MRKSGSSYRLPCICCCLLITAAATAAAALGAADGSARALRASMQGPPQPRKAYFITRDTEQLTKWQYTMQGIAAVAATLGLNPDLSEVEVVYGTYNMPDTARCAGGPEACRDMQLGLSVAHLEIWKRMVRWKVPAAYIFEEDVVFHQDLDTVLPQYWREVPQDYELVFMGKCQEDSSSAHDQLLSQHIPWCTHAMVVSQEGAQRLSRGMAYLLDRFHNGLFQLHKDDVKIDWYLKSVWRNFMTDRERRGWVSFNSVQSLPAKWGNRTWHGTRHLQPGFYENGCNCMNLDQATPACQQSAPIRGVGLAYQNVCKQDPGMLERWRLRPAWQGP